MKKKAATTSIKKLAKAKVKFAKRNKTGTYTPVESKREATHKIRETANDSAIAEPVKRGRKSFTNPETLATVRRPKPPTPGMRYGPPRIANEQPDETPVGIVRRKLPEMPQGATHCAYTAVGGRTTIIAPASHAFEFETMRGELKFGRLRHNEDFVSMMPEDEGTVTPHRDGVTRMATGNEPGSGNHPGSAHTPAAPGSRKPKPPQLPGTTTSAAPKPPRPVRSGPVARPKAGSKTEQVWAACDALKAELGRVPTSAEVATKLPGHNSSTISVQRSAWAKSQTA